MAAGVAPPLAVRRAAPRARAARPDTPAASAGSARSCRALRPARSVRSRRPALERESMLAKAGTHAHARDARPAAADRVRGQAVRVLVAHRVARVGGVRLRAWTGLGGRGRAVLAAPQEAGGDDLPRRVGEALGRVVVPLASGASRAGRLVETCLRLRTAALLGAGRPAVLGLEAGVTPGRSRRRRARNDRWRRQRWRRRR